MPVHELYIISFASIHILLIDFVISINANIVIGSMYCNFYLTYFLIMYLVTYFIYILFVERF